MKLIALLVILISMTAMAETMDMETTNLVINKLERLMDTLDTDSTSRIPMALRLADAVSDRARLFEMEDKQNEAKQDRLKAIKLLNGVYKSLDKNQKSQTLSQMAHLYQLTGQPKKAEDLFKQIIAHPKNHSQDTLARAYLGMAEVEFNKAQYRKAEKHYLNALKHNDTRKNFITTRLAWCHYHSASPTKAIDTLYGPLARGDFDSDPALKEDAARDYATFLTLRPVTDREIKTLAAVSPDVARKNIMVGFATELDRLGKKKQALAVWHFIGTENKSDGDLDELFRIVQIQYDLGHKEATVEALKQMLDAWKNKGCDSSQDNCELLQARVRKLITDWGASEERTPSKPLVQSYLAYVTQFPDRELSFWGAQAAQKRKMFAESVSLYRKAAELSKEENVPKMLEGATLGEIDVAEQSKNHQFRDSAYDYYLAVNPNGSKSLEVRYQKAHIQYEAKNFKDAAESFHGIATSDVANQMALREKAADISIESLIAAKEEIKVEEWALEYSRIFSHRSADFQKTARDAVINRQARIINDKESSKGDLEDSLEKLKTVNIASAPNSEKLTHFKNRLVVAEKLEKYSEVDAAANGMLALNLSAKDREYALSRKQWAAEMTASHVAAFNLAKQLKMSGLADDERLIKLATLAEKAGQNPNPYYEKYLSVTRNQKGADGVISVLVRQSASGQASLRTFKRHEKRISQAELKATLALEIYAKTGDEKFIRQQLQSRSIRHTTAGVIMARFVYLSDFQFFMAKNKPRALSTKTPALLKRSLNDRLYLITKTENQAKFSIKTGDWIYQLVTLDALKKQYDSLAYNINALPVPRGLNKKQKQNYKQLLAAQAHPYAVKADSINQKIYELSKNTDGLVDDLKTTAEPLKRLVVKQAQILVRVLPEERGLRLKRELSQAVARSER